MQTNQEDLDPFSPAAGGGAHSGRVPCKADPDYFRHVTPIGRGNEWEGSGLTEPTREPLLEMHPDMGGCKPMRMRIPLHSLVRALDEAVEGGCPHIVGRCVIGATFPPAPEQLAKTKLPVIQVDLLEAAYKKADEQPTPNNKLMAFNSLVELVKALGGLLNYFPTTRMQYINDGPMVFLLRRCLLTVPSCAPAKLLKTLDLSGELERGTPRFNLLISYLAQAIISEGGMKALRRNEFELCVQGPGQSSDSFAEDLMTKASRVGFTSEDTHSYGGNHERI